MTETRYRPAREDGSTLDYGMNPDRPWERRQDDAAGRPWTVTVASLLAFAFAGFHAFVALVGFDVLWHWDLVAGRSSMSRGDIGFRELLAVVFGLAFLWGGFAAWRGLDRRALILTGLGMLAPHIFHAVVDDAWHALLRPHAYEIGLLVVVLLTTPSSRDYFRGEPDSEA